MFKEYFPYKLIPGSSSFIRSNSIGMGRGILISTVFLLALGSLYPIFVDATESVIIEKGGKHHEMVIVEFPAGGGLDPSLSIPLDRGGPVISGSFYVSNVEGKAGPEIVTIDLGMDGRADWSFGGGSQGRFGEQYSFLSGDDIIRMPMIARQDMISFNLPEGAIVRNSSIVISSPPTPEVFESWKISQPDLLEIPVGGLKVADINGNGKDEVFYYSSIDSSIKMLRDDGKGSFIMNTVISGIDSRPRMGTLSSNSQQTGGLLVQYRNQTLSENRLSFFTGDPEKGLEETLLSRRLPDDMVSFSIYNGGSGEKSKVLISGDDGIGAWTISFDKGGSRTRQLVIDNNTARGGVGAADMDGNGKLDLILFPDSPDENISIYLSGIPDPPSSGSVHDLGTNVTISGPGVPIDIDGDGRDEFYFPVGPDGDLGLVSSTPDGGYSFSLAGLNLTDCDPSAMTRDLYGDSGLYDGGEGFLAVGSVTGFHQVLPKSNPLGEYIKMDILGKEVTAAMGYTSHDQNTHIYHIEKSTGIVKSSIYWSSSSEIELNRGDVIIKARPGQTVDLSDMIGLSIEGSDEDDVFGNRFGRIEISIIGQPGFLSLHHLNVEYDVSLDVSRSSNFFSSLKKTSKEFGGESIPFMVTSSSAGEIRLGPVIVTYDSPPIILDSLPRRLSIKEGSMGQTILSTRDHILDDLLPPESLTVSIEPVSFIPEGLIFTNSYGDVVTHASIHPDFNGIVKFRLNVSDGSSSSVSGIIEIVIEPVQDLPELVFDPGELTLLEGEETRIRLSGEGGIFRDPDGDRLHFSCRVILSEPASLKDHLEMGIEGDFLTLVPSIFGTGGTGLIEVKAMDDHTPPSMAATIIIPFTTINVDSIPMIQKNPGPLILTEDQDTPSKVSLDNWIVDPDTPLSQYKLVSYSSDSRLITYFDFEGSNPYLFIIPTEDLTGRVIIWIEVIGEDITLTDRLDVEVRPVNDLPEVTIRNVDFRKGSGWVISGTVHDPDDNGGKIEYRIGTGEWRDAWGFKSWSFLVEKEMVSGSGAYVFVRADDSKDISAVVFTKILWPYDPPKPVVPIDPTDHDTEPSGNPVGLPSQSLTPQDPDKSGPPWYIAGGLWSIIIGGLIFLLWTETGFVTVMTGIISIYSKLSKKDILNHEIRGLIRGYIIANPGDHYSSIKRNLDLNNGTLAYHLRVLEQNGFIKSMYDGIYKRYYPANINISKLKKNVSKQEEIFNIILETPGTTMEQIGREIGVSRQVVNYHVKNLIRAGVVTYTRDSKSARFYPSDSSKQFDQT